MYSWDKDGNMVACGADDVAYRYVARLSYFASIVWKFGLKFQQKMYGNLLKMGF